MSATATRVAPTVALDDEFAEFEVRDELERQLEKRLSEVDLDTSPALKSFEPNADNDQLGIIRAKEPLIRLVAPAGSGKTQTVVNRVLKLASAGTRPDRILCLTFDNSAATALREKLAEQTAALGSAAHDFTITTLNAFGFRILRDMFPSERKDVIEVGRSYRLLREVKDALLAAPGGASRHGALPETLRLRFYMEFFSLLKNETFDPRSLPAQELADFMLSSPTAEAWFTPGMTTETKRLVIQAVHWMFKAYEQRLQRENRLDFDDQKLRALACLQGAPEILQRLQRRYEEVIVDEFQDINKLDFELIRRIAGQARLIVTGDDDQAIYGFRGCSPTYIIDLAKHLDRDVTTYELRRNYRCPKNIVDHSTRLIRNNTWRLEKNPIAHRPENATIKVVESTTATAEAKALATTILRIRSKNASLQLKDFAVLYRTNAQSLPIQLQFILRDIPYTVRQQDNILHNEELEKLLGVLRVKLALQEHEPVQPHDGVLALKSYFRTFDQRIEHRLELLFGSTPFFDAIASGRLHNLMPKARSSNLPAAIAEVIKQPSLFKTLDVLAKDFKGLRGMVGSLEEVIEGDVPLGEVYELAASFRGSVEGFVETVGDALGRARAGHAGEQTNGVNLLTYFKAKGLQWHTVMLTSCNQGIIPHKRAKVDDERRLFYVALTRASSNLIVSYLKTSCKTKVPPSIFLTEAGFLG